MIPIVRRELLDVLRTRKALALLLGLGAACALLVLVRWPTGAVADLGGHQAQEVLRVFGYGLLAGVLLLVPAVPAASLVREKAQGTLALLLNSPLRPWSIYLGKLLAVLGFAALLLTMTLPAAAACYALGGLGTEGGVVWLYAVLATAAVQLTALALLVSSRAQSADSALRTTYALVLVVTVLTLVPHLLLRGGTGTLPPLAEALRCLSPIAAVMELLGHGDVGTQGEGGGVGIVSRYLIFAAVLSALCALATIWTLSRTLLDRARDSGTMTEDRGGLARAARRVLFLVDPQRRSGAMSLWVNPVMVKEFRARRFGRSHWLLRLVALSAILSLGLSYVAASGALSWGVEYIGGALVLLQVALLVLFAPSLAAGLISSERESGSWQLLRMTPLRPGAILRGKLLSVAWPLLLLLCATLPGYVVLTLTRPELTHQVGRVLTSLALTAVFAVLLSAAASALFRATAAATVAAYAALLTLTVGPMLIWLGGGAPFGHATVEAALLIDPVAGALQAAEMPGFTQFDLLPTNWYVLGGASVALLLLLMARTWQLCRPS